MMSSRVMLRLLAFADASGTGEALVGDLLEEISRGRSRWWLGQQVIGLYVVALAAHTRHHARLTPSIVALALSVVLLGGASIVSIDRVVEAWIGCYLLAGTLSLFGHMAARAQVNGRL
jgi:hypothetical protein